MKRSKGYSKMWLLVLLLVVFMAGCADNTQETPITANNTAPTVNSTSPANAATVVPIGNKLTITFSEAMDPATINTTTFIVKQGTTPVSGTVTYSGVTAVFTPASNFATGTVFTATITTGAKTQGGKALTSDYVWNFTTGTALDTIAPTVSSTVPLDLATGVATNSSITATFSEAMDPTTITTTTFTVKQGTTPVSGTVTYSGVTAVFTPTSTPLAAGPYTAMITTGAKDLAMPGNALAVTKVWSFTIGAATDTTAPTVLSTIPLNLAINVATNSTVSATFSEAMAPLTITATTFTLTQGTPATSVSGAVTYSGVTAVFAPTSNLLPSTVYTATIATGAKDLAGNALAVTKVWSFTTDAVAAKGPAPVLLGAAGNYVILATSGVSTVPASVITGDIGLSPAATSFLTGFSLTMVGTISATSPQVIGNLYGADMSPPTSTNLTTAVTNMGTAYTDAAGRPTPDFLNLGVGEIGGQTIIPGLYKWTTGVTISSNVIISGGPNDIWIFQVPGNLAMNPAMNITLSGGAQAKNIFWQVAGAVSVGTTSHFEGIILSKTSITLGTGASINGRLLAQTAVSLDKSTVTKP